MKPMKWCRRLDSSCHEKRQTRQKRVSQTLNGRRAGGKRQARGALAYREEATPASRLRITTLTPDISFSFMLGEIMPSQVGYIYPYMFCVEMHIWQMEVLEAGELVANVFL